MSSKKLTAAERFAKLGENLKKDGRLQIDEAKLQLSEQIFQTMENKGISESELSRRLDVSRAYINKVLQGDTNFTIETLVKIGIALDCEFKFSFVEKTVDIIDAEIIYIKEKPVSKPDYVSFTSGYKPNGFYDFEDIEYKTPFNIPFAEMQF
jgi:transcriptional regulator with XRE-family HTH domain